MSTSVPPRLHGRLAAALACALVLAGCASSRGLTTSGQPLDADTLGARQVLGADAFSAAAFPRQDWWNALGDPQLDGLIREALQGSPSLAAADARLRQAKAQAGLADAQRKPTLDATGEYSGVQLPKGLAGPEIGGDVMWANVLMLDFKWAPDLWGGQRAAYEAAVGQARAAEVDAQAARLTLSANIARTYISLSQAYEALDVARREQQRSGRLRDLSQQRVDAGLDNNLQLRQAESTIASARQQEQAAQQQIDALRNALAALLGKGPDRGLAIAQPKLLAAPAPSVPGVLPSELLGHRADVVAARWRVEAANRGIDARKAAFKPSVNLSAIVGLASSNLSDLFDSDAVLGLGGPAISLPIFDGGRLRANLDNADAQYDLAVASYNGALVGAMHEVADAVQSARSLDAQVASLTAARDAAQKAYDLASNRYDAGLGTQLDVLSAQRPLLQLEQQLADLHARRYVAVVDLDQALGGGLPLTAPTPSSTNTADTSTP
ncbi:MULTISPECIES: efflux transporter outer membrane subunit [Pseudoxanthomonas]|uniref:NodT family efflux transporter outer membrane factor (OMF) lipoprotein n=1 Tax=Pseudoxanthomonas winnipegensis TaxID=2480810 RepID=A0AAW8GAQ7_9GAMM|nr:MULTISPECIES: efflux transporter outer membrane subunit [Pseudoxanthomonas]MDQ1119504.1 NodT family efflux transporter outer membrane factor (OMF) lipoprotein [Pseudoxanthomonas winnipegensis]MDQ1132698.1 NodT family efflux transporter outer membrane factor (OMF) lipoprotein [Pseudoxanthomonas winnipegensis]MDR6137294.1 NodT family efflux transporter outer membrane factor (OMF) lipoprotein [Pseudoxanthomonas sp. SORGH_AS_0997]